MMHFPTDGSYHLEECEIPLYRLLHDELGFDVITCPLRLFNEFGGGIHCGKNIAYLTSDFPSKIRPPTKCSFACIRLESIISIVFVFK